MNSTCPSQPNVVNKLHSVQVHEISQKLSYLKKMKRKYNLESHTYLYSEAREKLAKMKLLGKFDHILGSELKFSRLQESQNPKNEPYLVENSSFQIGSTGLAHRSKVLKKTQYESKLFEDSQNLKIG